MNMPLYEIDKEVSELLKEILKRLEYLNSDDANVRYWNSAGAFIPIPLSEVLLWTDKLRKLLECNSKTHLVC